MLPYWIAMQRAGAWQRPQMHLIVEQAVISIMGPLKLGISRDQFSRGAHLMPTPMHRVLDNPGTGAQMMII